MVLLILHNKAQSKANSLSFSVQKIACFSKLKKKRVLRNRIFTVVFLSHVSSVIHPILKGRQKIFSHDKPCLPVLLSNCCFRTAALVYTAVYSFLEAAFQKIRPIWDIWISALSVISMERITIICSISFPIIWHIFNGWKYVPNATFN